MADGFWSGFGSCLASWHRAHVAWLVLALSAVASVAAWYFSSTAITEAAQSRFATQTNDIRTLIVARMHEQQMVLRGGLGLFEASEFVSRDEWRQYYEALDTQTLLPGLQGLGYAEFVAPDDLDRHIADVRAEGFPDFTVKPEGQRALYSSIVYLEPFDARNQRAFGYDMWSEPARRAAMERARDTGKAAVSGMVRLVQENGTDVQHGFLMYLPLYKPGMATGTVTERRAAIKGFVYSPFRIKDLMQGILGAKEAGLSFRIYDGATATPDRLIYEFAPANQIAHFSSPQFTASAAVEIHGHPWRIEFVSNDAFISAGEAAQPILIAVAAVIIDALLFLTILSLTDQRRRAARLIATRTEQINEARQQAETAARREAELRLAALESNDKLIESNRELTRFASIVAHDLRAPLKRVESFVDVLCEDFEGQLDDDGRDIAARILRNATRMR